MTLFITNSYANSVITKSGYAEANVLRAVKKGNVVDVEIRFETDINGYSGETIYQNLSLESWKNEFYIEVDGKKYPLSVDAKGNYQAPESLKLTFCYNVKKNPRVGSWKGSFIAPNKPFEMINIAIPNLPLIKNIRIK